MAPVPAYILCTSPRSGSTLLCRMLAATGVAGNPDSHFHRPALADWRDAYALDIAQEPEDVQRRAILKAAIAKGKGDTSIFGLRLQRQSAAFFLEQLNLLNPDKPTDRARIEATFGEPCFIHLTRHNKVAQAISYLKAEQTGLWHKAPDGTEIERLSPPAPAHYDSAAIAEHRATFETYDREWKSWFAAQGITPLTITYEDLASAPQKALAKVLDEIGQDPALAKMIPTPVAKLADQTNHEWETRFRTNPPSE